MTQAEFARQIGIVQSHLSGLERGEKEPCAAVLFAISKQFGKSVDWLLTGEAPAPAKNADKYSGRPVRRSDLGGSRT